ncbi:MAG: type VI secretion system lipoprotein TssJ [Thiohalocapsa sp.]
MAILLTQGCGGGAAPKLPEETTLQAKLAASDDVNSGSGRSALPIVVRLYELKSAGVFSSADFFSLYQREADTLGSELIAREEVSLSPGQGYLMTKKLPAEAAFLGVVAAFRDIDHAQWRDVVRLNPNHANKVFVTVSADSIAVAAQ